MTSKEIQKVNKWDSPTEEDLFDRDSFVETIVRTIESADEGFNFGISARWGEGKSSILKRLKPKLEKLNYKVLEFKPWKYTQDQISIKRKFIIDIYNQLGKEYDETELYLNIEKEVPITPQKRLDIFCEKIATWIIIAVPTALVFILLLLLLKKITGWDLNIQQIFFNNLFIPVLVGLLPLIKEVAEIKIKQPIPKIESAEQFEKKFNNIINEIVSSEPKPKRVIIFIDDLDRCNHNEVEQVLTALFTFFSNKDCIYIITADHTVIRRYIGEFLDLTPELNDEGKINIEATNDVKRREATEYLKKIFQINWILPKIPPDLLETWIKDLLKATPIIQFKNPYAESYLIDLIRNNFESNPRKIKHFIRTLSFQLEVVEEKIKKLTNQNKEEKRNLQTIRDCPELLAKILIIQDKFPESYEKLPIEPNLLKKYESGEMAEDIELQKLIAQEPKFFNSITRTDNKTVDPYYFIYFSGSTGFIEPETVDPSQIKGFARGGDFDSLNKIISGLTDEPRNTQIEHIRAELLSPQIQPPEKVNVIRSLFHVVSLIEESRVRIQKISDLINLASQYEQEFKGIQSIDIEKIAPHIDTTIAIKLFKDSPFIEVNLRNQIWNGFFHARQILNKDVAILFLNTLSEKLTASDEEFQSAINIINQLEETVIYDSEFLSSKLAETFQTRNNQQKQQVLDTVIKFKKSLRSEKISEIEKFITKLAQTDNVEENNFIISNIPTCIKDNFNLTKLTSAFMERLRTANVQDREQLFNNLSSPNVKDALGPTNFDNILKAIVADIISDDVTKVNYVISKIPQFISLISKKQEFMNSLLAGVKKEPVDTNQNILNAIWSTKETWINESNIKKYFIKKIKSLIKNTKDENVKTIITNILNELEPPKDGSSG